MRKNKLLFYFILLWCECGPFTVSTNDFSSIDLLYYVCVLKKWTAGATRFLLIKWKQGCEILLSANKNAPMQISSYLESRALKISTNVINPGVR